LPEEWCEASERRRRAKIPEEMVFKTKPELAVELVERSAGWEIPRAPILGDCAYGKNTDRRDLGDLEYVLSVSEEVRVFVPETVFRVPEQSLGRGRPKSRPRPDRKPEQIGALIARLSDQQFQTVTFVRARQQADDLALLLCGYAPPMTGRSDRRSHRARSG